MDQITLRNDANADQATIQQIIRTVVKENVESNKDARDLKLTSIRDVHMRKEQAIEEREQGQQAAQKGLIAGLALGIGGGVLAGVTSCIPASSKLTSTFSQKAQTAALPTITQGDQLTAKTLNQKVADFFIKKLLPSDLSETVFSNMTATERQKTFKATFFKDAAINGLLSLPGQLSLYDISKEFTHNIEKGFESTAARFDILAERANAEAEKAQVMAEVAKDTSSAAINALSQINSSEADSIKQIVRA